MDEYQEKRDKLGVKERERRRRMRKGMGQNNSEQIIAKKRVNDRPKCVDILNIDL